MRVHRSLLLAVAAVGPAVGLGSAAADLAPRQPVSQPVQALACRAPSAAMKAEVERLFAIAGEHASASKVCMDGNGHKVTIAVQRICVVGEALEVRYTVTRAEEYGGECSPYPQCAEPPPPTHSDETVKLKLSTQKGLSRIAVPALLPGVAQMAPLASAHSMGCHGKSAAYVPRAVAKEERN